MKKTGKIKKFFKRGIDVAVRGALEFQDVDVLEKGV